MNLIKSCKISFRDKFWIDGEIGTCCNRYNEYFLGLQKQEPIYPLIISNIHTGIYKFYCIKTLSFKDIDTSGAFLLINDKTDITKDEISKLVVSTDK